MAIVGFDFGAFTHPRERLCAAPGRNQPVPGGKSGRTATKSSRHCSQSHRNGESPSTSCVNVSLIVNAGVQGCAENEVSAIVSGEEQGLLTTLAFDLSVTHPYELLGEATRELGGEDGGWETLAQVAGQLLNDR